jgi:4-amino-4-deoxy-L-arabinose transferase-like glycosyltransferase
MPQRLLYWLCALAIFVFGSVLRLRVWHPAEYQPGFDEQVYISYVEQLNDKGWTGFPEIVGTYIVEVQKAEFVYLPPLRVAYIGAAWALGKSFGMSSYEALRLVSALASCLFALAGFLFARRWLTPKKALAVLELLACAPLQIHLGQFAFIDALAGLWAVLTVGCLWESLQQPRHWGWLAGAAGSFFGLCCTKQETAVFVGLFLFVALVAARRAGWSPAPWRQAAALALAGLLSVTILAVLSGGLRPLAEAFTIYHERAKELPYSILTGDGPWYRYLLEHLLVNPLVFVLAVGFVLRGNLAGKQNTFLVLFVVITGAVMTSIPNGMNIRHTVMWDFPLALFAVQCAATLAAKSRHRLICATAIVGLVCFSELRQYGTIFRGLYDTDPRFMLRAVRILK